MALTNLPEENKYGNDKKEEWCKKLGLSSKIDIHVVHRYSHLGENLLRITYNSLGVKLKGTIQVCDACARSKKKPRAFSKKTYTRASQPG